METYGSNPKEYLKLQSSQSLAHGDMGEDGKRVRTTGRAPVRPARPAEPVLHPLVSSIPHLHQYSIN